MAPHVTRACLPQSNLAGAEDVPEEEQWGRGHGSLWARTDRSERGLKLCEQEPPERVSEPRGSEHDGGLGEQGRDEPEQHPMVNQAIWAGTQEMVSALLTESYFNVLEKYPFPFL